VIVTFQEYRILSRILDIFSYSLSKRCLISIIFDRKVTQKTQKLVNQKLVYFRTSLR